MGKGKPRKTEREKQRGTDVVILQRTVYISGQDRDEGACVQPNSNILDRVHEDIITEYPVTRTFNFNKQKWELFPQYNTTGRHDPILSGGWNGLRKLLPWIDRDMNVECRITTVFNDSETQYWDKEFEIEKYEKDDELYSFHAEADFWCVTTEGSYKMLCKGKENGMHFETDDGYVDWDCYDRGNGFTISDDSPLNDIFPDSKWEGVDIEVDGWTNHESVGIPFKIRVYVDADIDTDTKEI